MKVTSTLIAAAMTVLLSGTCFADEGVWTWQFRNVAFDSFAYNPTTHAVTVTYPSGWTVVSPRLDINFLPSQSITPGQPFTFNPSGLRPGQRADVIGSYSSAATNNQLVPFVTPLVSPFCPGQFPPPYRSPHDTSCTDPVPQGNQTITVTNNCDGAGQDHNLISVTCTGDTTTGSSDADSVTCSSTTTTTSGGETLTIQETRTEQCGTIQNPTPSPPTPPSP